MLEGMATKSNPRKDLNQSAFAIVRQATGEVAPQKNAASKPQKLTPEQRSDIAKKAALKRKTNQQSAGVGAVVPSKRRIVA